MCHRVSATVYRAQCVHKRPNAHVIAVLVAIKHSLTTFGTFPKSALYWCMWNYTHQLRCDCNIVLGSHYRGRWRAPNLLWLTALVARTTRLMQFHNLNDRRVKAFLYIGKYFQVFYHNLKISFSFFAMLSW